MAFHHCCNSFYSAMPNSFSKLKTPTLSNIGLLDIFLLDIPFPDILALATLAKTRYTKKDFQKIKKFYINSFFQV